MDYWPSFWLLRGLSQKVDPEWKPTCIVQFKVHIEIQGVVRTPETSEYRRGGIYLVDNQAAGK